MAKEKAKIDKITKPVEAEEREFFDPAMAVEGTKELTPDPATSPEEEETLKRKVKSESVSINDLLPQLRKKGMRI